MRIRKHIWAALDRAIVRRKRNFLVILRTSELLLLMAKSNGIGIWREMAMMSLVCGLRVIVEERGLPHGLRRVGLLVHFVQRSLRLANVNDKIVLCHIGLTYQGCETPFNVYITTMLSMLD